MATPFGKFHASALNIQAVSRSAPAGFQPKSASWGFGVWNLPVLKLGKL